MHSHHSALHIPSAGQDITSDALVGVHLAPLAGMGAPNCTQKRTHVHHRFALNASVHVLRFYVQRRIKKRGHNARGRRRKEERLSNPRPTALPCTTTWFENHPPPHPQRMPTAFYGRSKPVRSDMRCGGALWNGKFCIHVLCVIERGGRLYFALRRPWQHVLCLGTY